jgi:DME family drug/metabolite transporter
MTRIDKAARRGMWSIAGAGTLWGTTGVATRALYALSSTNALSLAFLRLVIAALIFLLLCWRLLGRRMWRMKGRDALLMLFMGSMQAVFQYCYLAAIPACGVTIATLIALCVAPVIVVLCAALFLRERPSRKVLLALLCALGGTILLTGAPAGSQAFSNLPLGVLLSLASATGYAGVILSGRALSNRYHPLQINSVSFASGALILLLGALSTRLVLVYPAQSWLLIVYLGCVPTALAYTLFQAGMRTTPATLTSILTLCEPLTAAVLAWLLFGERLGPSGILGALLLFATILLLARGEPAPAQTGP